MEVPPNESMDSVLFPEPLDRPNSRTATGLHVASIKLAETAEIVQRVATTVETQQQSIAKLSILHNSTSKSLKIRDMSDRVPFLNILSSQSIVNFILEVQELVDPKLFEEQYVLKFFIFKCSSHSRTMWSEFIQCSLSWNRIKVRLMDLISSSEK